MKEEPAAEESADASDEADEAGPAESEKETPVEDVKMEAAAVEA